MRQDNKLKESINMTPQQVFEKQRYALFNNVLSKEMCKFLTNYMFLKRDAGYLEPPLELGGSDSQCPLSWSIYGDPAFDTLLAQLTSPLSAMLGVDLLPAYTYARIYQPGEVLEWHVDRPSCEISGTMTIGKSADANWPIYVGTPGSIERVGAPIDIGIGELLMYSGCEVPHWRDEFDGEWQVQVFFHYVRKDGPYAKEHIRDGRASLGILGSSDAHYKQVDRIVKYAVEGPPTPPVKPLTTKPTTSSLKPFKFEA